MRPNDASELVATAKNQHVGENGALTPIRFREIMRPEKNASKLTTIFLVVEANGSGGLERTPK